MYSCERDFEATDLKAGVRWCACYAAAALAKCRPALGHIELSSWDSARTLTECIAPSSVRFKSRVAAAAAAAVTAAVANIGQERHESTR